MITLLDKIKFITPTSAQLIRQEGNERAVVSIPTGNDSDDKQIEICLSFPLIGVSRYWFPSYDGTGALPNLWTEPKIFATNLGLPMFCFYNELGRNRLTITLSEATKKVEVSIGVHEESAAMIARFVFPDGVTDGKLSIHFDDSNQLVCQSIQAGQKWLYQQHSYRLLPYNETAYSPVYSTWYSYHQSLSQANLEQQLEKFDAFHLQTLILDDGWQTDDSSRRYSFAGDWQVATKKFPDMAKHISIIQEAGVKYLIWVSLPYIGEKTKAFLTFKDKFLYFDEYQRAGILDPRYPEVRTYLVETLLQLVKTLNIDGLKIDFVDAFKKLSHSAEDQDKGNLEESLNILLTEITAGCLAINPNFLFEFRENYFGPNMAQFCNIIRVKDCPNDFNQNRIGLTNIRLLCPNVAPHSDMIMFNKADSLASICLQFLSCLYGVIQLSVDLQKLTPEQNEAIQFWMAYQFENKELLLHHNFIALNPHLGYDVLIAGDATKQIITCYQSGRVVDTSAINSVERFDLINATLADGVVLSGHHLVGQKYAYTCFDLTGKQLKSGQLEIGTLQELDIPACGLVKLSKI